MSASHFEGSPCSKCSGTLRYTSGRSCVACARARATRWAVDNASKHCENVKRWQSNNGTQARAIAQSWKTNNPNKLRAGNAAWRANDTARKFGCAGKLATADVLALFEAASCALCGTFEDLELDHKRPLSMGGSNTPDNLRVLCRTHNMSEYWRMKQGEHIEH